MGLVFSMHIILTYIQHWLICLKNKNKKNRKEKSNGKANITYNVIFMSIYRCSFVYIMLVDRYTYVYSIEYQNRIPARIQSNKNILFLLFFFGINCSYILLYFFIHSFVSFLFTDSHNICIFHFLIVFEWIFWYKAHKNHRRPPKPRTL